MVSLQLCLVLSLWRQAAPRERKFIQKSFRLTGQRAADVGGAGAGRVHPKLMVSCFWLHVFILLLLLLIWALRKGPCVCVGTTCQCSGKLFIIINGNKCKIHARAGNTTSLFPVDTSEEEEKYKAVNTDLCSRDLITCQSCYSRCWRCEPSTHVGVVDKRKRRVHLKVLGLKRGVSWCVTLWGELGERSPVKDANLGTRLQTGFHAVLCLMSAGTWRHNCCDVSHKLYHPSWRFDVQL